VRGHPHSPKRLEPDLAFEPDATPHQSAPSRAQTPRDQASPYHPGRTHPCKPKQCKTKKNASEVVVSVSKNKQWEDNDPHQIPRNRCGSSLDLSHITRTRRPSSLASGPGSVSVRAGPGGAGDAGMGGGTSIEIPRQPAFWRFRGTGVGGGGAWGACTRTLAEKTAS
jgi:hypothetical protein